MNVEQEIIDIKKEIQELKDRLQRNSNNDITDIVDSVKANQSLHDRIMRKVQEMLQEHTKNEEK
jgi:hypothetical protein